MAKLWSGRFAKETAAVLDVLNASLPFDCRLYRQDITGSIAHARMLAKQGIISKADGEAIVDGLTAILEDIAEGRLPMQGAEDIHSFVEQELTARIGDAGKRLHTARSRNDQVALDMRMYVKEEIVNIREELSALIAVICRQAQAHLTTVMPGYTHLQRAQPVTLAHVWMAYGNMLKRDCIRLDNTLALMDEMPLGSGALASTTYPIDRQYVCEQLGFAKITDNSMDGVSDRDYCMQLAGDCSILMVHLSRICEEIILWCTWEYRFAELDDAFSTGSSIMPQKKNPDICELIRGKSGRVFGDLMTLLSMQKGLSLAYNKDMQEDKEALFDVIDTVKHSLQALTPLIDTMKFHEENMKQAALGGYINATDCADYLTKKGVPFRDAYRTIGELVAWCIEHSCALNDVSIDRLRQFHPLFEEDVYQAIDLQTCVRERKVPGGPAPDAVQAQIDALQKFLAKEPNA